MGGDSPPLKSGECHCFKLKRSCGGVCTGLAYSGIAMMEKLNELYELLS